MKKLIFSLAMLVLLCASCATDAPEIAGGEQKDAPKTNLEYALAYAEDLIGQLDPPTRGLSRKANVQVICDMATRAGAQDTLLYLVNYDDNMGFALLDAEGKNGGVYAISPKGHLEFADSVKNPALAYFFNKVKEAAAKPVAETRGDFEGTIVGWKDFVIYTIAKVNPILCDRYADWCCENIKGAGENGTSADITTAALTMAKMLAYFYHPSSIAGTSINWNYISGSTRKNTEINKLLYTLNSKEVLGDYSPTSFGTSDLTRKITPSLLNEALYNIIGQEAELFKRNGEPNFSGKIGDMKDILAGATDGSALNGPLIVYAQPMDAKTSATASYVQYWIVDGYMDRHKTQASNPPLPIPNVPSLYHCVWGMEDYINGYYTFDASCMTNELTYEQSPLDPDTSEPRPSVVIENQENQFMFPNPGVIGGYKIRPYAQP